MTQWWVVENYHRQIYIIDMLNWDDVTMETNNAFVTAWQVINTLMLMTHGNNQRAVQMKQTKSNILHYFNGYFTTNLQSAFCFWWSPWMVFCGWWLTKFIMHLSVICIACITGSIYFINDLFTMCCIMAYSIVYLLIYCIFSV